MRNWTSIRSRICGAIEEFAYYSDEPSADAGALPVWFLSKLCRRKTTVALSGEGADELFGGYLTYRANRMARSIRAIPGAAALGLAVLRHWPVSDEKMGFDYKATRLLEGSRMGEGRAHVYWNGTFAQDQLRTVVNRSLPASLNAILGEMGESPRNGDDLAPFLWLDQKYYLADDILTKSDRMSMAHSVEVRPPFLDHRIVEFAARLPANQDRRLAPESHPERPDERQAAAHDHSAQGNRFRHSRARVVAHHLARCWRTR